MPNQLIAMEMALAVQRERMGLSERNSLYAEFAQGRHSVGSVRRAMNFAGAIVQKVGRPFGWGTAPAVAKNRTIEQADLDRARLGTHSISTARF